MAISSAGSAALLARINNDIEDVADEVEAVMNKTTVSVSRDQIIENLRQWAAEQPPSGHAAPQEVA